MADRLVSVACPVCKSKRRRDLFLTRDYKQRVTDDEFRVSRCRDCSVGYLSLRPAEAELGRYYDERFYWSHENDARTRHDPDHLLAVRGSQLRAKAEWLPDARPGRLLDIGTMKGEFLYYMAQQGWTVQGVEFSTTPPNVFDMPIRYGEFLAMEDLPVGFYDCITLWAVLEHVYRPMDYMKRVAELLKPGGSVVLLVTNFNSVQGRIYEMDDYPRHLTLFTRRALRRMLADCGLEWTRSTTDQRIFGGHLQGGLVYFVKRLCGYSRAEALYEWKDNVDLRPFFHGWRGDIVLPMRAVSRIDRLLLGFFEPYVDRLGMGFTLTVEARKPE